MCLNKKPCKGRRGESNATPDLFAHTNKGLNTRLGVLDQILIKLNSILLEQQNTCRSTIREIAQLVTLLQLGPGYLSSCQFNRPDYFSFSIEEKKKMISFTVLACFLILGRFGQDNAL